LWRGSRDGFTAQEFHRRCDSHANTLTLISDTDGNIFGGFTPLPWECDSKCKCDDSLQSFVFTLKNPHNVPPRKSSLKAACKRFAMCCHTEDGPRFGGGSDIRIVDACNANTDSYPSFGHTYVNDTGVNGKGLFACSHQFKVHDIEIFEISDSTIAQAISIILSNAISGQLKAEAERVFGHTGTATPIESARTPGDSAYQETEFGTDHQLECFWLPGCQFWTTS
jgi:hypothetical protein